MYLIMSEMEMLRENFNLVNKRVEKMEKMMKKIIVMSLEIETKSNLSYSSSLKSEFSDKIETKSNFSYSFSSKSEDSLEFKEFLDEEIWETNKNNGKECNECGSMDIEKDDQCEGDIYVFWCNECNSHVGASVNEKEMDYSGEDFEWCDECQRFGCKCNEDDISCEGCRNDYLNQLGHMNPGGCLYENPESISNNYRKRNLDEIESDDEIDFKRNKYF